MQMDATAISVLDCAVQCHGSVRLTAADLQAVRQNPNLPGSTLLPAGFLKHADEQTVAGVAAVYRALQTQTVEPGTFTGWCVLGAPRFIGRNALAGALKKYQAEGAWGVSPHLIPHRSLHALSGTISQALKIHGPNFGVGGGPNGAAEGLLTAAALIGDRLPGVWVVLTGWDPEPIPDQPEPESTVCNAVALALVQPVELWEGWRLRVYMGEASRARTSQGQPPSLTLESIQAALHSDSSAVPFQLTTVWPLDGGGMLSLEKTVAGRFRPHRNGKAHTNGRATHKAWIGNGTEKQS
jgi:hypothetical protein